MLRKIPIVEMMGQDAAASSDPLKTTYYFHVHNIIVLTMFYEPGLIKRLFEQDEYVAVSRRMHML